jgi:glycosyltransferase 2 family protein
VLDFARRLGRSVWFRAAVSLGLLALVVSQIDLTEARVRLSGGRWGLFVAAIAVLVASFVVGALRWHIYLTAAQVARDVSTSVRAYLIGVFTNNFLPSQVGGDVARAWVATAPGTRLRGATTVVFDRVTALACLIAVGWIAYATNADAVPWELVIALAASTAAVAVGSAAAVLALRTGRVRRLVPARLRGAGREVREASLACAQGRVLTQTLTIGLGFQGLVVLAAWLIARSLELELAFSTLAVMLAPVLIVSVLPISIGGFGVREGSYVILLSYAGISSTDAALLSLLSAAAFAVASLPGGLALVRRPPPVDVGGDATTALRDTNS